MASAPGYPHTPCSLLKDALTPCPRDALLSLLELPPGLTAQGSRASAPCWTPRRGLDTTLWERTGTPLELYQVPWNCLFTRQASASQENKFICLKSKLRNHLLYLGPVQGGEVIEDVTAAFHTVLASSCVPVSSQMSCFSRWFTSLTKLVGRSSSSSKLEGSSVPVAAYLPSISDNPNAF